MAPCRRSVCLFGLSADPPTGYQGHVGIVQALQKLNEWHEIWIIPVYRHTFSDKRQRLVSFEHRWKMCELAFSELSSVTTSTKIVISDAEYQSWQYAVRTIVDEDERRNVSVGTASLLDYLLSADATAAKESIDYSFCLGADAFLDLTAGKWNESARVLQYFTGQKLVVLHRTKDGAVNDETVLVQTVAETGSRLIRIGSLGGISSSQVRACQSMSELNTMVGPKVAEYIQTHGLYQFAPESQTNER